jgi:putative RNA 2'-phosphotransferase
VLFVSFVVHSDRSNGRQISQNQQVPQPGPPAPARADRPGAGKPITREQLEQAIATNDKQRFALSPDGTRIRANQGHSVEVDLGLVPQEPPELLYHGTARQFLEPIRAEGLVAGKRQHVHLSADVPTALKVGSRHGQPVPLTVRAGAMHRDGLAFYRSENGVWLTDNVPPEFIVFP